MELADQRYAICPKPHCNYSSPPFDGFFIEAATCDSETKGENIDTLYEIAVRKPLQWEQIKDHLPDERFCEKCGEQLLFYCPHCKIGSFTIPDPVFCRFCGKKIKT